MVEADKTEFAMVLTALAEHFDKPVSPTLFDLYFTALQGLTFEQFKKSAGICLRVCKFMPKVAELLEYAGAGVTGAKDRSLAAWLGVIQRTNAYASVEIHDPALAATLEAMGGWIAFCSDERETHWIEKEFRELYEHFDAQRLTMAVPALMPGLHEDANAGLLEAPPVRRAILGRPSTEIARRDA